MKFKQHFTEYFQNLSLNFIVSKDRDDDVDCFGVGAMMPQEFPEIILLSDTELYGV